MPKKNKFGGKKGRKTANKKTGQTTRGLRYKDADDQDYALVGKAYGTGRFAITIYSNAEEKIGVVCGSLYKRVWIREGDTVLISIRTCNSATDNGKLVDIIHKYKPDEAKSLERSGELKKALEETKEEQPIGITFEGDVNDDSDDGDSSDELGDFIMGI